MLPIVREFHIRPLNHGKAWSEFDRLFERFWGGDCSASGQAGSLDVYEDETNLYVEAELPGFKRDEIQLTLDEGVLHLAAEHSEESDEKEKTYYLRERGESKWSRSLRLPINVAPDKIEATLDNGVLKVRMEKQEQYKAHKIEVK